MKEIISIVAVVLTFLAYIPYYRDILRGKTKPHVYMWSLWSLLTILVVGLQIKGGAGSAIWVTVAAGLLSIGIIFLSLKNGKKDITTSDKIVAVLSLLAIIFWLGTDQPVVATILVILADMLAFFPTIRKSYHHPHAETLSLYATNAFRYVLVLIAVEEYTFLSSAWIIAWIIGNTGLSVLIAMRRSRLH